MAESRSNHQRGVGMTKSLPCHQMTRVFFRPLTKSLLRKQLVFQRYNRNPLVFHGFHILGGPDEI